jgi:polyisoprenoid-binding protein YceI
MPSAHRRWAVWLALGLPLLALAEARLTGTPTAGFAGRGPGGFTVEGTTHELRVQDDGTTLKLTVPLGQLTTGIALRDRHMREKYLEVAKFPELVLELPWSTVKLPSDGQRLEGSGTGKVTLHGQSKDVPIRYAVQRAGSSYQVTGHAAINLKDFGIEVPSYFGITVQPDIDARATFTADKP